MLAEVSGPPLRAGSRWTEIPERERSRPQLQGVARATTRSRSRLPKANCISSTTQGQTVASQLGTPESPRISAGANSGIVVGRLGQETAMCGRESSGERRTVPATTNPDDSYPERFGELVRTVNAAVIGEDLSPRTARSRESVRPCRYKRRRSRAH